MIYLDSAAGPYSMAATPERSGLRRVFGPAGTGPKTLPRPTPRLMGLRSVGFARRATVLVTAEKAAHLIRLRMCQPAR